MSLCVCVCVYNSLRRAAKCVCVCVCVCVRVRVHVYAAQPPFFTLSHQGSHPICRSPSTAAHDAATHKLRPASDGGAGRCARLGIQPGDVVLQVNGTDIGACAAASGASHFSTACQLLREAPFPLQVTFMRLASVRPPPETDAPPPPPPAALGSGAVGAPPSAEFELGGEETKHAGGGAAIRSSSLIGARLSEYFKLSAGGGDGGGDSVEAADEDGDDALLPFDETIDENALLPDPANKAEFASYCEMITAQECLAVMARHVELEEAVAFLAKARPPSSSSSSSFNE